MLFDLRGRGRRRTVQVIYLGLAILFGVGFVGFGVGVGGGGGGLLNALTGNEGTSSANFDAQIKKDRKLVAAQPNNPVPLAALIKDLLREAGAGENYNNTAGTFTSKASGLLHEAAQDWQHYLVINPRNPSADIASLMLQVYGGPGGLNEPASAVTVLQIMISARPPSEALYADLAQFAYKAHNTRQGDLASSKAVSLAPKAERGVIRTRLAAIKKNPSGEEGAASSSSTSSSAASGTGTPPVSNGTVTIGGKTYKINQGTAKGKSPTPVAPKH